MRLKEDINPGPKNIKGDNSRIICTGERGDISGQVLFSLYISFNISVVPLNSILVIYFNHLTKYVN